MPRFYKGVGVGTFLHSQDLRVSGIMPRNPGGLFNTATIVQHIARATTTSPCISLSRSYGVAEDYARNASRKLPTAMRPAFVYEIDIGSPLPKGMQVVDPVGEILTAYKNPLVQNYYQHDGAQGFLLGVVDPVAMKAKLTSPSPQPPGSGGTIRPANLTGELEAIVRALRDAEILVVGNLPQACVINRFDVY